MTMIHTHQRPGRPTLPAALAGLLLAGAVGASTAAIAAPLPVEVLGLPLGGQLPAPIRRCALDELGAEVRTACWVDAPYVAPGGARLGRLAVPGSAARPRWAAHAVFEVTLDPHGTLEKVAVQTRRADDFIDILDSVSRRFGKSDPGGGIGAANSSASWDRADVHIFLHCARRAGCETAFTSPAGHARQARELAARQARNAARPLSP